MQKIKSFVVSILSFAVMMTSTTNLVASAGNTGDSYFYNWTITSTSKYTTPREKLDYTSSCVKVTSAPSTSGMIVKVYASKTETSAKYNKTVGTPKIVTKSSSYTYLPNFVQEFADDMKWPQVYGSLGFTKSGVSNFTASGAWSPDSI